MGFSVQLQNPSVPGSDSSFASPVAFCLSVSERFSFPLHLAEFSSFGQKSIVSKTKGAQARHRDPGDLLSVDAIAHSPSFVCAWADFVPHHPGPPARSIRRRLRTRMSGWSDQTPTSCAATQDKQPLRNLSCPVFRQTLRHRGERRFAATPSAHNRSNVKLTSYFSVPGQGRKRDETAGEASTSAGRRPENRGLRFHKTQSEELIPLSNNVPPLPCRLESSVH